MELNKKNLPRLDEELIKFLQERFPPLEYTQGANVDTFSQDAIFRAGQRDIINLLNGILKEQQRR